MKHILFAVALVSLMACLAAPAFYVWGTAELSTYYSVFLVASVCWFGAASAYSVLARR